MDSTAPLAPSNLSFLKLIENADPVVQGVMLSLALASVICWTIGFEKLLRYAAFFRQVRAFERFAESQGKGPAATSRLAVQFQIATADEAHDAAESPAVLVGRIEQTLGIEINVHLRRLQAGLPILATVGSTAPFVGLFGTVWGIMNSFTGIAAAKDTSLAVVAPGIAEALLATAIGLVAAIPAVILYNLAGVFLSNCSDRLSVAANRYAKAYVYGDRKKKPNASFGDRQYDRDEQALIYGGIDTR
jgi:biopolymer transport protein TolQ